MSKGAQLGVTPASFSNRRESLRRLLSPRSIAVVGATERPNAPSRRLLETLKTLAFAGVIAPVHPTNTTVLGLECYRSLADIPAEIDAAAFCVDEKLLPAVVGEAAAKGIRAGVIYGGIRDPHVRAAVVKIARNNTMAICGPNCMGILNPASGSTLYLNMIADASRLRGNVALVTQSGSVAVGMLGDCRRYGFSHVVSCGDESVTTMDEYVEYLVDDNATGAIALFIETVRDVAGFTAALDHAAAAGKPVVALKIGRSALARDAVVGHTGGIAGDGRIFSALMARHNGIEVTSLEEMTEVLAGFQAPRRPAGPRVGIVTASGGQVEMILDEAGGALFELPSLTDALKQEAAAVIGPISGPGNPLDAWGSGDYTKTLAHGMDVMSRHPDLDAVAMFSDTNDGQPMMPTRYTDILLEASKRSEKPFYFLNTRSNLMRLETVEKFTGTGVGMLTGVRQGLGALGRMGIWARRAVPAPTVIEEDTHAANGLLQEALQAGRVTINEIDAKVVLRGLGLRAVDDHIVTSAADAAATATRIGYPVVLKVASDSIPHRSEHGLVHVGLSSPDALALAWEQQAGRLAAMGPVAAPVLHVVQPMASAGIEVIVGVARDPELGPYIAFGAGGVLVELLGDAVVRPLPLRQGEAEAMVRGSRIARLLDGFRGNGARDVVALVRLVERVAAFAWTNRSAIREIDINPVFVGTPGQGCFIADALIVPA